MAAKNFLPSCMAFQLRIFCDFIEVQLKSAMVLGLKFLAAIFSIIVYCWLFQLLRNVTMYFELQFLRIMFMRTWCVFITVWFQATFLTLTKWSIFLVLVPFYVSNFQGLSNIQFWDECAEKFTWGNILPNSGRISLKCPKSRIKALEILW